MAKVLTALEGEVPLTKTFSKDETGQITKVGHPKIINYVSHQCEVESLEDMFVFTLHHAKEKHCLLKGNVTRELKWESRAGTTDQNAPTWWLCLDLDGHKHVRDIQEFMESIDMGDVSRIDQYSASSGILPGRGLSAHVFVMLDRELMPAMIKQWLVAKNIAIAGLRSSVSLSRTGNALRWPLDITTCQNDKLIYIAPPLLENGVEDTFAGERIQLVKKAKACATLDMSKVNAEANKLAIQTILDGLREAQGLKKKRWDRTKTFESVEYMPNPDASTVNGIREDRDFIYLNLNDGDSWGYWHPKSNPQFIRNWKGEPVYKTSELLPDYWASVKNGSHRELAAEHKGLTFLAFRDFRSSAYWNGTHSPETGELRVAQAKSEAQLRAWLGEHGQPQPEDIPTWDVVYDPHKPGAIDVEGKWMNMYQPSEFDRRTLEAVAEIPPTVRRVLHHALGCDEEVFSYMVNWLACVLQFKEPTETAIIMHGVQGTGKGLIFNHILRPMLGIQNTVVKRMEEMDSQFNGFLEGKQLLFIDEGEMQAFAREKILEQNFKNFITEPVISVRHMHQTAREVRNYLNIIVAANRASVNIDSKDRRYTVGEYQKERLAITPEEVEQLKSEAWPMYCYLRGYKADRQRARMALNNAAKKALSDVSQNSIEVACEAIREGDWEFFNDQRPTALTETLGTFEKQQAEKYTALVDKMAEHQNLTRDEMRILVAYVCGEKIPLAPAKFSQLLKNHRIETKSCRRGDTTVKAFAVNWRK